MEEMSDMVMKLRVHNCCGKSKVFPNCPVSIAMCRLKNRKCLNFKELGILQAAGFRMEYSGEYECPELSLFAEYKPV